MKRPSTTTLRVIQLLLLTVGANIFFLYHADLSALTRTLHTIDSASVRRATTKTGASVYPPVLPLPEQRPKIVRNSALTRGGSSRPDIDESRINPLAGLKVAIHMTTHLSELHKDFLRRCWPAATQRLTLLKQSDLILFTSSNSSDLDEWLEPLQFANKTVRYYDPDETDPYHGGAKLALVDPLEGGYLDIYDWVIRLNPDVLIRNETWLLTALQNPDIDGIFAWCNMPTREFPAADVMALRRRAAFLDSDPSAQQYARETSYPDTNPFKGRSSVTSSDEETISLIHTDFMAFRPRAIALDSRKSARHLSREIGNTEFHATKVMESIISSGRHARIEGGGCFRYSMRMLGRESPVIHFHELLGFCPDYFDAHGVAIGKNGKF
jgi:hypothetical protein